MPIQEPDLARRRGKDREQLVQRLLGDGDNDDGRLLRVAFTGDAGLGKTINLQELAFEINGGLRLVPGSDPAPAVNTRCAAFRFRLPKLPVVTNQDFERCALLPEFRLTRRSPASRSNQSCTPAETARALIVISEPARCWSQRGAGFSGNASGPSSRSSWACSSSRNPPTQAAQPAVACHRYRHLFPIKQRQAGKGVPPAFVISEGFGEHVLRRHPKRTTFLRLEEHDDDSTDAIPSMCQLRAAVL